MKDHNIKMSAIKAGCKASSAHMSGLKMRQRDRVNTYIAWLKVRQLKRVDIDAFTVLEQYAKMAFYDVTDYVEMRNKQVLLKNFDQIDGQIIQEIGNSAQGQVVIKFADRMKALEKLENYMDTIPSDWKRKVEERKLDIMEERLRLEKIRYGEGDDDDVDDGFIQAIKESITDIYADEEEEEDEV